ncbi:MAG: glycosyl transferase family protein [Alphaproteobacteria bacterium]|nr:glycosyl transferase family protein [Alphaproteobacteria bacterium]
MIQEHPFAQFIRIIGKGPQRSRSLTEKEAFEAMNLIMAGAVEPVQLGALLCLIRVRTETSEEVAGFVRGIRASLPKFPLSTPVDLDWPTYAGKSRQLPWFLLAALLLAQNGVRVFMHGADGHTPNRVWARDVLIHLGLPIASSMEKAAEHIATRNFAYVPLESISPRLQAIFSLRELLGVRSPVHTVARQINPVDAPCQILSVIHPPYRAIHRDAARLLGQPRMVVFKGDGGEAERRPVKPLDVASLFDGATGEEEWPVLLPESVQPKDQDMNLERLTAVWRDDGGDPFAARTITGTLAVALRLLGQCRDIAESQAVADDLWAGRNRERIFAA